MSGGEPIHEMLRGVAGVRGPKRNVRLSEGHFVSVTRERIAFPDSLPIDLVRLEYDAGALRATLTLDTENVEGLIAALREVTGT